MQERKQAKWLKMCVGFDKSSELLGYEKVSSFEEILENQGVLVYTNTGNSMMPLLRQHRDILIIKRKEKNERLHRFDIAFYKRDCGKYILHRILWVRKHDYVICGDNQWYPERGITDQHILGVLDSVVRDGKTIPLRQTAEHPHVSWKYRLYVHLWCDLYVLRAPIVFLIGKLKRRIK